MFEKETHNLIGFAVNNIRDNSVDYSSMKFNPAFLKLYSSYALIYTMNKYYLEENKCKYVSDGARALSHQTNIQELLINKFNFREAYCKLQLSFSPWMLCGVGLAYPFRRIIYTINHELFKKLSVVLKMVEIVRADRNI